MNRHTARSLALLAMAGLSASASAATAVPVPRAPVPTVDPDWHTSNRQRAQWKAEINKRGRNR